MTQYSLPACPSCDALMERTALRCDACGFELAAMSDTQILLNLMQPVAEPKAEPSLEPFDEFERSGQVMGASSLETVDSLETVNPYQETQALTQPNLELAMAQLDATQAQLDLTQAQLDLTQDPLDVRQPPWPEPTLAAFAPEAEPIFAEPGSYRAVRQTPLYDGSVPSFAAHTREAASANSVAVSWDEPPSIHYLTEEPQPTRLSRLTANPRALGLAALAAAVVVGVVGMWALNSTSGTAAAPKPVVTQTLTLTTLANDSITASASSTLKPKSRGYRIENTLDGRLDTAWNSDGEKDGQGVGVKLGWAFEKPHHVMRITVRNGYLKSRKDADVFQNNGRLHTVVIRSATKKTTWNLADTPQPQSLNFDFGDTQAINLQVVSIYPGEKYPDLALTDISFAAAS